MNTLRMNDGTVFENSSIIAWNGIMSLYFEGEQNLQDIFSAVTDPEKMKRIVATFEGTETVYTGYVRFIDIQVIRNGLITARVQKSFE